MHTARKRRRQGSLSEPRLWLPILAILFLVSMPTLAQGSIEPKPRESSPPSPRRERLYTEEEALAAAEAAAKAAVEAAIPPAVQAAVAEERGKAAAQQFLDKSDSEAFRRQAHVWRAATLVAAGACTGSLADGGRGALYGATVGALSAVVVWIAERWPRRTGGQLEQ
jgi:hypothetical protein